VLLVNPSWCVWCYGFGIIGKVKGINGDGGWNLVVVEKQITSLELEGNGFGDVDFRSCEAGKVHVLVLGHKWALEIYQDTIVKCWNAARRGVYKSTIGAPVGFEGLVEFMVRSLEFLFGSQSFART